MSTRTPHHEIPQALRAVIEPPDERAHLPLRRIFGEGEDALTWSFPVGRCFGVHVRLHFIVPLWAGAEIVASCGLGDFYFMHGICAVFAFVLLAVVRELARLWLARALGSDADQAIIWPLGGVSPASRAGIASPVGAESGGLLAGMLLWPALALGAWLAGLPWSSLSISPFNPLLGGPDDVRNSLVRAAIWWLYYANMIQVLLNLLVPMLPLDAGRMLFTLITSRRGRFAAAELAGRAGAFGAVSLLIVGSTADQSRLIAIGVIGFLATVSEVRRTQFAAEPCPPRRATQAVATPAARPDLPPLAHGAKAPPDPLLDLVLDKIARRGMASLTPADRRTLDRETRLRNPWPPAPVEG